MAQHALHLFSTSLKIFDTPVGYEPPRGFGMNFLVTYTHREANQPANFTYSSLGPKWSFNWLSYVTDEPLNTNANVTYFEEGGGTEANLHTTGNNFTMDINGAVYMPTVDIDFPNSLSFAQTGCTLFIAKSLAIRNGSGNMSNSGCAASFGGAAFLSVVVVE